MYKSILQKVALAMLGLTPILSFSLVAAGSAQAATLPDHHEESTGTRPESHGNTNDRGGPGHDANDGNHHDSHGDNHQDNDTSHRDTHHDGDNDHRGTWHGDSGHRWDNDHHDRGVRHFRDHRIDRDHYFHRYYPVTRYVPGRVVTYPGKDVFVGTAVDVSDSSFVLLTEGRSLRVNAPYSYSWDDSIDGDSVRVIGVRHGDTVDATAVYDLTR